METRGGVVLKDGAVMSFGVVVLGMAGSSRLARGPAVVLAGVWAGGKPTRGRRSGVVLVTRGARHA
jgi:hypothetical protein